MYFSRFRPLQTTHMAIDNAKTTLHGEQIRIFPHTLSPMRTIVRQFFSHTQCLSSVIFLTYPNVWHELMLRNESSVKFSFKNDK